MIIPSCGSLAEIQPKIARKCQFSFSELVKAYLKSSTSWYKAGQNSQAFKAVLEELASDFSSKAILAHASSSFFLKTEQDSQGLSKTGLDLISSKAVLILSCSSTKSAYLDFKETKLAM